MRDIVGPRSFLCATLLLLIFFFDTCSRLVHEMRSPHLVHTYMQLCSRSLDSVWTSICSCSSSIRGPDLWDQEVRFLWTESDSSNRPAHWFTNKLAKWLAGSRLRQKRQFPGWLIYDICSFRHLGGVWTSGEEVTGGLVVAVLFQ